MSCDSCYDHVILYSLDLLESLVHYEVLRHDTLECKVRNLILSNVLFDNFILLVAIVTTET